MQHTGDMHPKYNPEINPEDPECDPEHFFVLRSRGTLKLHIEASKKAKIFYLSSLDQHLQMVRVRPQLVFAEVF